MIADRSAVHAVRFGGDRQLDEFARRELFRRRLISKFEFSHAVVSTPSMAGDPQRPAPPSLRSPAPSASRDPVPRLWDMAPVLNAVTETVHLVQGGAVNWTLVADDSGVMLIDAGYPGDRDDVLASLRQLGYLAEDVRAILLTHAHIDHLGSAIWFAKTHGTPVYCHADEVGHTKREYLEQASPIDVAMRLWRPRWARWTAHLVRDGGLSREGIPTAQPLTAEVAAELPGRPMAIPTPGHTGGHCSYLVDGVLVTGDALVTGHPLLSRSGPQLLPKLFSHDQDGCIRSLAALALLDTEILLPGHGDLWRGPILEATKQATALAL
jgi:glyoxylase-like metal-dependent hydrolase (beta-lactamase superfamily II)